MNHVAILYIQSISQRYEQEIFLVNELRTINTEVFIVCDEIGNLTNILKLDKEHIIEGKFNNRIEAYSYAYRCFKIEVKKFDALIMCDNSFFGPFIRLSEILTVMKRRELDCWMFSKYARMYDSNYRTLGEHVDSSFVYFTNKMARCKSLKAFWNKEFFEDELSEEIILMDCLNAVQAKWGTYVDYEELDADTTINNIDWLVRLPYTMLHKYGSPIIKMDSFIENDFRYTSENETLKAIEYVKEYTVFDERIIWNFLLENYDIADIINILHLHYVIPETCVLRTTYTRKKCAIIMHITYIKALEKAFMYVQKIPEEIDLYITSKGQKCIELIKNKLKQINRKNYKILLAGDRGRDISALLVTCKNILMGYEYLCFVHDNKTRNNLGPGIIGESYMWSRWDNSIKNAEYISNILELFESNEKLGIVVPPVPYSGGQFIGLGWTWSGDYETTLDLAERLGLSVNISKEKYNYSIGTTFWCRTKAMRKLFEAGITYDDFQPEPVLASSGTISHAIERILLYVAQDAKYYAAIVENNEYAAGHINDLNYMMNRILNRLNVPISGHFDSYLNNIDVSALESFAKNNEYIYIYGDGYIAHQVSEYLRKEDIKYKSYVISDGREKKEKEKSVIYLSQITEEKSVGIIVAVSGYYQREVVPVLIANGYTNLYIV